MKCPKCKTNQIYIATINEYACPVCTKCPKCGKESAIIDKHYGVMMCKKCAKKQKSFKVSRYISKNKFVEYIATPFWKHMGLKPKPKDIIKEKWMKSKNLTYGKIRMAQIAMHEKYGGYSNEMLVKSIKEGRFHGKSKNPSYRRERIVR